MNRTKALPVAAVALCIPGVALRALHVLHGFDIANNLPIAGDPWVWYLAGLLAAAMAARLTTQLANISP